MTGGDGRPVPAGLGCGDGQLLVVDRMAFGCHTEPLAQAAGLFAVPAEQDFLPQQQARANIEDTRMSVR